MTITAAVAVAWPGAGPAGAAAGKVQVVAGEDFWGSIARQLGGDHADVTSLISDPDTDPHDYEAKPSDGAAVAGAEVAIVNGIGYDAWMGKLVAANPSSGRKVVTVGDVVGVKDGGNPHQWYSPRSVRAVIDAITAALKQADPADTGYFDAQRQAYLADGLKRYDDLRAQIRARFAGVPVGASESIFAPLAEDLGLKLLTPESFLDSVSEGNDPTARDKTTVESQISAKQIKLFVYNAQNATPDVTALVGKAKQAGIPVATVTETLVPAGASFQDWQADQLQRLADALDQATAGTPVSAAQAPASAPTAGRKRRNGSPARWPLLLAGAVLGLAGVGLAGNAARRRRSPLRGA
ncbi:MAG TPA: zinc ABC transporter substrate-binding protein [Acidimicrobiia bacterium]|nr:zinc ABC transporter substrate-binding protein [Acidimicrobiia bacterium]